MCHYISNPYCTVNIGWDDHLIAPFETDDIRALHRSIAEYIPTPLHSLPGLAQRMGLGKVLVKDESERLGLKAFKVLGASYAIYRLVDDILQTENTKVSRGDFYRGAGAAAIGSGRFTFCTATDGNHGRAVAWAARRLGQKAVIFMPQGTARARIEAIREEGAEIHVVEGDYDYAVSIAAEQAATNDWQVVSDTSWTDYQQIPRWIQAGYRTLFEEIHEQPVMPARLDLVIIPVGVGALAAAAAWYYRCHYAGARPHLVAIEPTAADCLFQTLSNPDGEPVASTGKQDSAMAGLNCGTLSPVAWPLIKTAFDGCVVISDDYCFAAMRRYYYPGQRDRRITSGESGASGLGALIALTESASLTDARQELELDSNSNVLLLNTEGDTDPVGFRRSIRR